MPPNVVTATTSVRLTTVLQVSEGACSASTASAFAVTGADFKASTGVPPGC
jgi:hypothetical protein